jgi:hypothetical protein
MNHNTRSVIVVARLGVKSMDTIKMTDVGHKANVSVWKCS